jgi:hypothetical protein
MKVLRKIVGKPKIDTIRSQQISESCVIQAVVEWVERRIRECEEDVTGMDDERFVKISRDNIHTRRRSRGCPKRSISKCFGMVYARKKEEKGRTLKFAEEKVTMGMREKGINTIEWIDRGELRRKIKL